MRAPPPSAVRLDGQSADVILFPCHRASRPTDRRYSRRMLALVYGGLLSLSLGFWAAVLALATAL